MLETAVPLFTLHGMALSAAAIGLAVLLLAVLRRLFLRLRRKKTLAENPPEETLLKASEQGHAEDEEVVGGESRTEHASPTVQFTVYEDGKPRWARHITKNGILMIAAEKPAGEAGFSPVPEIFETGTFGMGMSGAEEADTHIYRMKTDETESAGDFFAEIHMENGDDGSARPVINVPLRGNVSVFVNLRRLEPGKKSEFYSNSVIRVGSGVIKVLVREHKGDEGREGGVLYEMASNGRAF